MFNYNNLANITGFLCRLSSDRSRHNPTLAVFIFWLAWTAMKLICRKHPNYVFEGLSKLNAGVPGQPSIDISFTVTNVMFLKTHFWRANRDVIQTMHYAMRHLMYRWDTCVKESQFVCCLKYRIRSIRAQCAYTISWSGRAHSKPSNGGFWLEIG